MEEQLRGLWSPWCLYYPSRSSHPSFKFDAITSTSLARACFPVTSRIDSPSYDWQRIYRYQFKHYCANPNCRIEQRHDW
jgi:hypothetical protein